MNSSEIKKESIVIDGIYASKFTENGKIEVDMGYNNKLFVFEATDTASAEILSKMLSTFKFTK